jgi:PKD repeat protein
MRIETRVSRGVTAVVLLGAVALLSGCFLLPNELPVATFTATPTEGSTPLFVSFDASGSYDPDGDVDSYRWAFGDGASGSGMVATHVYSTAGTYTARLTVEDRRQGTDTASAEIVALSQTRHAILVGIAEYAPPMPQLTYTDDDASAMRDRLLSLPGWESENVTLLLNQQATLTNFRNALDALSGASEDDLLLVFFSGHGNYYQDGNGDEADGYDEALEFYDGTLLDDTLALLLEQIPMRRLAVFIDSCFSGGQLDSQAIRAATSRAAVDEEGFLEDLAGIGTLSPRDLDGLSLQLVAVTASTRDEYSWELATLRHGIFTYALIEALDGRADAAGDYDGQTSAEEAFAYVRPRAMLLAAGAGAAETPQMLDLCSGELEIAGTP